MYEKQKNLTVSDCALTSNSAKQLRGPAAIRCTSLEDVKNVETRSVPESGLSESELTSSRKSIFCKTEHAVAATDSSDDLSEGDTKPPLRKTETQANNTSLSKHVKQKKKKSADVEQKLHPPNNVPEKQTGEVPKLRLFLRTSVPGEDIMHNKIYQAILKRCQMETLYFKDSACDEALPYNKSFMEHLRCSFKRGSTNFNVSKFLLQFSRPLSFPSFGMLTQSNAALKSILKNISSWRVRLQSSLVSKLFIFMAVTYLNAGKWGKGWKYVEKAKSELSLQPSGECHAWFHLGKAMFLDRMSSPKQNMHSMVIENLDKAHRHFQVTEAYFALERSMINWWMFILTANKYNFGKEKFTSCFEHLHVSSLHEYDIEMCWKYIHAYYQQMQRVTLQKNEETFRTHADKFVDDFRRAVCTQCRQCKISLVKRNAEEEPDKAALNQQFMAVNKQCQSLANELNRTEFPEFLQRIYPGETEPKIIVDISEEYLAEAYNFFESRFPNLMCKDLIKFVEQEEPECVHNDTEYTIDADLNSSSCQPEKLQNGVRIAHIDKNCFEHVKDSKTFLELKEKTGTKISPGSVGYIKHHKGKPYLISASHVIHWKDEQPVRGKMDKMICFIIAELEDRLIHVGCLCHSGFGHFERDKDDFVAIDVSAVQLQERVIGDDRIQKQYKTHSGTEIQLELFTKDSSELKFKTVQKLGGETVETTGKVIKTNFFQKISGKFCKGIFDVYGKGRMFIKKGDSGALVILCDGPSNKPTAAVGIVHSIYNKYKTENGTELTGIAQIFRLDNQLEYLNTEHKLPLEFISKAENGQRNMYEDQEPVESGRHESSGNSSKDQECHKKVINGQEHAIPRTNIESSDTAFEVSSLINPASNVSSSASSSSGYFSDEKDNPSRSAESNSRGKDLTATKGSDNTKTEVHTGDKVLGEDFDDEDLFSCDSDVQ